MPAVQRPWMLRLCVQHCGGSEEGGKRKLWEFLCACPAQLARLTEPRRSCRRKLSQHSKRQTSQDATICAVTLVGSVPLCAERERGSHQETAHLVATSGEHVARREGVRGRRPAGLHAVAERCVRRW
uniref:Uncharacterized protein n=1 Tax=Leishmania guyanensis TaxID=5670 RepID=A0A1E1IRL2_LEIGU|nr:hypothetical protein, conserved [Leishmania guyanensis]